MHRFFADEDGRIRGDEYKHLTRVLRLSEVFQNPEDALKAEKYDTWEWNYGRSPKFNVRCKRYWDGGCLEVGVSVSRGLITDVIFHGDFLSVSSLEPLTKALLGTPFRREEVCRVLERYPVADLFGGITREQVLDTLFSD